MKEEYKFIGFINMFDIVPDFVFPVFLYEKKYYFQSINNNIIDGFIEVKESALQKVQKIESVNSNINISNLKPFKLGSPPIYTFQLEEKRIFCGLLLEILRFFRHYKTIDIILLEQIQDFKKENAPYISKLERKTFTNFRTRDWVAKVTLTPGSGKMYVNEEEDKDFHYKIALRSLAVVNTLNKYDVKLLIPEEIDYEKNERVIRTAISKVLHDSTIRRTALISRTPQKYTITMNNGRFKIRKETLNAKLDESLKK